MLSGRLSVGYRLRNLDERLVAGLDRLLGYPHEKRKFFKAHGYPLNLTDPQSFNEKICWKKLFDRNPLLPVVADKLAVRGYVSDVLGASIASDLLIPLLWTGDSPSEIPFAQLPEKFVIKSNHGSGNNILVHDKSSLDVAEVQTECHLWLKTVYGVRAHEWAYTQIPRQLLIEEMLLTESGEIPEDYKFSMINGKCAFIQVDRGRFGNFTRTLYDAQWNQLESSWKRAKGEPIGKPKRLEEMLVFAEQLASKFDYIRVDFYSIAERLYFGELTHYPARGRGKFNPTSFDFELGKKWTLDRSHQR